MAELIDLHTHTTASDGTMTPSELVKYANKKGLKAVAITDHDTIDGVEEALREGERQGIEIVPGIELSVDYGREIHIIGLYINHKSSDLIHLLGFLRDEREKRTPRMLQKLKELGIDISIEDVNEITTGRVVARPHIAEAMVRKGYVKTTQEAFEKYIGNDGPAYSGRKKFTPEESIKLIKSAKGIPILAHPGLLQKPPQEIDRIIIEFKAIGLEGIEVFHSDHDQYTVKMLQTYAKRHDLLTSGGSDFHGTLKERIDLGVGKGNLRIEYRYLEMIKQKM